MGGAPPVPACRVLAGSWGGSGGARGPLGVRWAPGFPGGPRGSGRTPGCPPGYPWGAANRSEVCGGTVVTTVTVVATRPVTGRTPKSTGAHHQVRGRRSSTGDGRHPSCTHLGKRARHIPVAWRALIDDRRHHDHHRHPERTTIDIMITIDIPSARPSTSRAHDHRHPERLTGQGPAQDPGVGGIRGSGPGDRLGSGGPGGRTGGSWGGPGVTDWVPTAPDWPAWVGLMLTTHFDLVSGPFWASGGPKRARFCPKCPFWGPRRSSEDPEGPSLVPTAPDWSA